MDFRGGEEDDVDRISDLPQGILHHILSFLDLQQAIQISILSSKWRYVWRSLPFLNFHKNLNIPTTQLLPIIPRRTELKLQNMMNHLESFIYNVLKRRDQSSPIRKFHLTYYNPYGYPFTYHDDIFKQWILTALESSLLQDLYLYIYVSVGFKLPEYLFSYKPLQKLELHFPFARTVTLPNSMYLPCLETLVLFKVYFEGIDNDVLKKIFESCPLLESLSFTKCLFEQARLEFFSLKLKHLHIEDPVLCEYNGKRNTIKVSAPSLITFCCRDSVLRDYSIENLSSLVKAEVDLKEIDQGTRVVLEDGIIARLPLDHETRKVYAEEMTKILTALHNVETLKLSAWIVYAIAGAPSIMESTAIKFCNLKHLNLGTCLSRDCISAIVYLLNIAPIESIVVSIQHWYYRAAYPYLDRVNLDSEKLKGDWEASSSLQFMLYHLKFVKIEGVHGKLNELMFLKVLLKNGIVLEKMLVHTYQVTESWQVNFRKQLLAFPRASSSIEIVLATQIDYFDEDSLFRYP